MAKTLANGNIFINKIIIQRALHFCIVIGCNKIVTHARPQQSFSEYDTIISQNVTAFCQRTASISVDPSRE